MGKLAKTVLYIVLVAILAVSVVITVSNELGDRVKLDIRIEGVNGTVYAGSFSTTRHDEELSVREALQAFSDKNSVVEISGLDGEFITEVNGEKSGQFGGDDGWYYIVNNARYRESNEEGTDGKYIDPTLDSQMLNNTDKIVLYYGYPQSKMLFPSTDNSDIRNGVVVFQDVNKYLVKVPKPEDPTIMEDKEVLEKTPIVGAEVLWSIDKSKVLSGSDDIETATFTTDENGCITIEDASLRENGSHGVAISLTDEKGCPVVLRFTSDYSVTAFEKLDDVAESSFIAENNVLLLCIIMAFTLAVCVVGILVILRGNKRKKAKMYK